MTAAEVAAELRARGEAAERLAETFEQEARQAAYAGDREDADTCTRLNRAFAASARTYRDAAELVEVGGGDPHTGPAAYDAAATERENRPPAGRYRLVLPSDAR